MEKKRVPYGEKFWFIRSDGRIFYAFEYEDLFSKDFFDCGNYFHSKEEAERIKRLFNAVLNGADVIETPSEEEIKIASKEYNNGSLPNDFDYRNGFKDGVFYLESKIVK